MLYIGGMDWVIKIAVILAVVVSYPLTVGFGVEAFLPVDTDFYKQCTKFDNYGDLGPEQYKLQNDEREKCLEAARLEVVPYVTRNFIIVSVLGLLAILSGVFYIKHLSEPVRQGLVFGGVVSVLYANMRFAGDDMLDMRWRFVMALGSLVLIGVVSRRWFESSKK